MKERENKEGMASSHICSELKAETMRKMLKFFWEIVDGIVGCRTGSLEDRTGLFGVNDKAKQVSWRMVIDKMLWMILALS